jgi:hypothetical protein
MEHLGLFRLSSIKLISSLLRDLGQMFRSGDLPRFASLKANLLSLRATLTFSGVALPDRTNRLAFWLTS